MIKIYGIKSMFISIYLKSSGRCFSYPHFYVKIDVFLLKYYNSGKQEGKAKRPNGRPFVNVSNTAFYCYVIADLTDSMREDAVNAGLILTPDGDGYFGYNQTRGAYIEGISFGVRLLFGERE